MSADDVRLGGGARGAVVVVLLAALACGSPRAPRPPEEYLRVGVDPRSEASAVIDALEGAGFALTQRIDAESFIALAFVRREDGHRAVRVVTRVGVAAALDSHETDGVRLRHGEVRLVAHGGDHDLDRDGRPEVVLARSEGGRDCLAIIRVYEGGRARAARIEADDVAPGSCASSLRDVDGDGRMEAMVELDWPGLALSEARVPSLSVALASSEGGWRVDAVPAEHQARERASRREALAAARARLDVADASRLGVELAALANLAGAPIAAQVRAYDEALSGLVLGAADLHRVQAVRAYIAAGWAERGSDVGANTRAPSPGHEQEEQEADAR